jgi:hypothetical protein
MKGQGIFEILQHDVAAAKSKLDAASQHFDAMISKAPSGLPHPDGVQRIHNASKDLSKARGELVEAHVRLTAFIAEGIVPDKLKKGVESEGCYKVKTKSSGAV